MKRLLILSAALALAATAFAEETPRNEAANESERLTAADLMPSFRSIGPAFMSGRIADVAIDSMKPSTWYVAAGSGNLWKTTNAGTTWKPIFDNYSSYSLGCVTIDPNNRHTIWVGTGENVSGRHVGYGDGIYVSHDGGESFKNTGLEHSERISRIVVDPRNSQVVYVAAQGPLWSSGGERGLYKTSDGGQTWECVLSKGEWTGVTDVALDPTNPDVVYAATHQRHRTVWALLDGGPESGIFKSTDGGKTWNELTNGLPAGDKGKMSLAISPQKNNVLYVTIELANRNGNRVGGIWRSENFGASWVKQSDYTSGGTGPHYYQEIYADPHRFETFYHANVYLGRTSDGGKTFQSVESNHKHVDNHAVAFHPTDPDFLLVGCDGGLYRSYDRGETFQFCANLPITQFYKVDVDYDEPFYHVAGGTQDNNSQYGPTRTRTNIGIRNSDWRITIGGDGHDGAIDPKNPDIIYGESQQGMIRRFDRRTGESIGIRPQPAADEEELRFNWDSPILISPHSNTRIYFGSKKLHRSDDRGNSWTTISEDLSRNRDRYKLPIMGRVWSIDAMFDLYAMSQYGNLTSISESPMQEGLIYVGTDDGLIQVTEDGGKTWRAIDKFFGVPEFAFVNDVKADLHDVDTVYAVFDHHKTGDFKPYVLRSTDRGRTWDSISSDLPDRHIAWRIVQDHVEPELLFVGTEFGVFASVDAGEHWKKVPGSPTIPFRDLAIQTRENDLVGATFGRGFYVLDDYSPLRLAVKKQEKPADILLCPIRRAWLYVEDRPLGGPKGFKGDSYYAAENPPFGAVVTYYLAESYETREAKRRQQEAEIKKANGDNTYPGWDALKEEEREEEPKLFFIIKDAQGNVVDRITGPTSKGMHRIAWNLRYSNALGGGLVVPGEYSISAVKRIDDQDMPIGNAQQFQVVSAFEPSIPRNDPRDTLTFQQQAKALQKAASGTRGKLDEVLSQIENIQQALRADPSLDGSFYDRARALELTLLDLQEKLLGDRTKSKRDQPAKVATMRRIQSALSGTLNQTYGVTKTNREQYEIGKQQLAEISAKLQSLIATDFEQLLADLDEAGLAWTPGRKLPTSID